MNLTNTKLFFSKLKVEHVRPKQNLRIQKKLFFPPRIMQLSESKLKKKFLNSVQEPNVTR